MSNRSFLFFVAGAFAASLAGCGGGGGASGPVGPSVPPAPAPAPTPAPGPTLAPSFALQPATQQASAGADATFAASAPDATSFKWQQSTDSGTTWTDVPGATTSTLTVPAVTLVQSGTLFRVVASNAVGSTTSSQAGLSVVPYLRLLAGAMGGPGYLDAQGTAARFSFPRGSAFDAAGSLYVGDGENFVIRKISPTGQVTTYAGTPGVSGRVDGPLASASMGGVRDVKIDGSGTLWFVDQTTCYLRKIANGTVTSVASLVLGPNLCEGQASSPSSYDPAELAIGPTGDLFVSDRRRHAILRVTPAGAVSVFAGNPGLPPGALDGPRLGAQFNGPRGLAFDAAGNLYVSDSENGLIRRIDPAGSLTTLAGAAGDRRHVDGTGTGARLIGPTGLAVVSGQLAITDRFSHTVRLLNLTTLSLTTIAGSAGLNASVDGTGSAARFDSPYGISATATGDLLVSDSGNATLRKVTLAGVVTTFAGQALPKGHVDGTGANARFNEAHPVVADLQGNVYVADRFNATIRKITPAGTVTTVAGSPGEIGLVDGTGSAARFNFPNGLAIDGAGNLIVADTGNDAIRKVTPAGVVTTISGLLGPGFVDGTAATARFDDPVAVTVDSDGNIFVADQLNCSIRKITAAGVVSTFAGRGPANCATADGPAAVALVNHVQVLAAVGVNDVLFAEGLLRNPTQLRRAKPDGSIVTVAGSSARGSSDGIGSTATFEYISALAPDKAGNVWIADSSNNAVRQLRPDGRVVTRIGAQSPVNSTLGTGYVQRPTGIAVLPSNVIAITSEAAVLLD